MSVTASEVINSSKDEVWKVITDVENAEKTISEILSVKVLERPEQGVVGLKWQETRKMFGKEATETMWISAAQKNEWYETTAKNSGCIYNTRLALEDTDGGVRLTMTFKAQPETFLAKIFAPLSLLFSGALRKMLQRDLADIKSHLENP